MRHEHHERDPELERALSVLSGDQAPPPELEDRVVAALRRQGSIVPRRSPRRWALTAAAAALIAAGFLVGRWSASEPAPKGEQYLLLLLGDASLGDPEKERRFYDEYAAWGTKLAVEGHLVSAARLDDARPSLLSTDGPVSLSPEAGEGISGFFLIRARDEQEAIALARGSPHLGYGGRIEIRKLAGRP